MWQGGRPNKQMQLVSVELMWQSNVCPDFVGRQRDASLPWGPEFAFAWLNPRIKARKMQMPSLNNLKDQRLR